jgi:hypothetical protein
VDGRTSIVLAMKSGAMEHDQLRQANSAEGRFHLCSRIQANGPAKGDFFTFLPLPFLCLGSTVGTMNMHSLATSCATATTAVGSDNSITNASQCASFTRLPSSQHYPETHLNSFAHLCLDLPSGRFQTDLPRQNSIAASHISLSHQHHITNSLTN